MPAYRDIPDGELRIYLDLSTYCNAGCPQCDRTDHTKGGKLRKVKWLPKRMWDLERLKRAYPPDMKIYEVFICGTYGDPFMVKDIDEMIYYCLDNGWRVTVNTNGGTHDDFFWYQLGDRVKEYCNPDEPRMRVVFDVDGTTNEMHAKYRRFVDLGLVLSHMEAYTMAGGYAEAHTIVFKHNEDHLLDIKKLAQDHGATTVLFQKSNRSFFSEEGQRSDFYNENNEKEYLYRATRDLREATETQGDMRLGLEKHRTR